MALYTDVNQFNPQDGREILEDANAIHQSMYNLISTRKGERIFNPAFGTDIERLLHQLVGEGTELAITREVVEAQQLFETRVTLNQSNTRVRVDPDNIHRFLADFAFNIVGLSDQNFRFTAAITP